MKEFIKIMLLGMQVVVMSVQSIAFFVSAYLLFNLFLNAKGFTALFDAICIAVCIFMGFVMILILGVAVNETEERK